MPTARACVCVCAHTHHWQAPWHQVTVVSGFQVLFAHCTLQSLTHVSRIIMIIAHDYSTGTAESHILIVIGIHAKLGSSTP